MIDATMEARDDPPSVEFKDAAIAGWLGGMPTRVRTVEGIHLWRILPSPWICSTARKI